MSNYFKILIGFLLLSFVFISCENDIDHHDHSHDFQKQNIKVVKFNNIKDNGVKERLQNPKLNKNVNGRTVFDSINNFTVDLDKGVLIEKDGYDSYTFNIIREDSTSNYLENLVIGVYPNNEYKTFLYRYEVTPAEREMIKNFQFVDVTQKLNIYVIENTSIISEMSNKELYEPCYETVITQVPSYYVCPEGNHDITNYSACPYYQDGSATIREGYFTISTSIISCDDTGGSDTGNNDSTASGDTGTNSTSDGSSNTSSGSNTNNEITTLPYEPCTDCLELTEDLINFIAEFDSIQFNYWDSLETRDKQIINNYLQLSNYTIESKLFVKEAINYLILNPSLRFDDLKIEDPDVEILDIQEYLECFDISQPAKITIYADQPRPGHTDAVWGAFDVGHTFISIEQGNDVVSYGFYPKGDITAGAFWPVEGVFGNDEGHLYDVSVSLNVSGAVLQNIINLSYVWDNTPYALYIDNCTDFGIEIGNLCGLGLPVCEGNILGAQTSNPGKFGEHLRTMTLPTGATRQTTTNSSAPSNVKTCF